MFSSEGEKVELSQSISTAAARGAVEKWLLQVQDIMIISVRDVIERAKEVCHHSTHSQSPFHSVFIPLHHLSVSIPFQSPSVFIPFHPIQAYILEPRIEWVREWPGQVVICASQIYWTAEVHEAIRGGPQGTKEYHEKLQSQVRMDTPTSLAARPC